MGEAMRHQGVEALEVEERLDVAAAGGIAVVDGREIGAEGATELGAVGEHLHEGLADEARVHVGVIEPLRQAMAHGILEPVLAQDGRVDEAPERRLVAHGLLGLLAQIGPDRVDGRNVGPLGHARFGCHVPLLRGAV
jgi:hypothetical protein